jgi:ligand-binding sensor domain-containing protein
VNPLEKRRGNFVANVRKLNIPQSLSLYFLLLLVVMLFAVGPARALDPNRHISQYAHSAWRTQEGVFSSLPMIITQTADGYLWIGTNLGLVRFDGVRFASWSPPAGKRLLDSRIFSLLGTRDGSLIVFRKTSHTGHSKSKKVTGVKESAPH